MIVDVYTGYKVLGGVCSILYPEIQIQRHLATPWHTHFCVFICFLQGICSQWCIIMSHDLKFARESCPDREGKLARRRIKSAAFFTHFLTQKFTPLSIPLTGSMVNWTQFVFFHATEYPKAHVPHYDQARGQRD